MHTIKNYIAQDGTHFGNRFACAEWELVQNPTLLAELNESFAGTHLSTQQRWCGGDPDEGNGGFACGCMGCANHNFYKLGLQYEHWKVWIDKLRGEQPYDNIPTENTDVDLILRDIGPNRIETFKLIRSLTGLGIIETKALMDTPNAVLSRSTFYSAQQIINCFKDEAGATVDMVVSENQRWTKIS
jgi:ribosomal protein L7/L12